ncbi:MAG TPA: hypothetical protein VJQ42_00375, partial [Rhodanobacteraceae bacterium]|nr:hypothetical protein [Rhodanobacteraceae bacterium]
MARILGRNDIRLRKDVAGSRTQVIDIADRRTHDIELAAVFSWVRHRRRTRVLMNDKQFTSALLRAARTLTIALLAATAA